MRNGGDLHHVNAKLVENRGDAFFWKKLENVEYGWNPHLDNILIVNQRDPEANPTGAEVLPRVRLGPSAGRAANGNRLAPIGRAGSGASGAEARGKPLMNGFLVRG